ncbi:MAG: ABC transporter ATP-binding protein [Bacteroidales bacterium]|nr:ABC transporter ATP-binding protein [Bacteroidales bacterium]
MEERKNTLSGHGLSIGYADKVLHRDLNLELQPAMLTCLLGPNGAGKSTLMRTLSRLQEPLAGEVRLGGRPMQNMSHGEISRMIAVVMTDNDLFGGVTVYDVIMMGRHPHTDFWGTPREKDRMLVEQAMDAMSLTPFARRPMASLSDGERQKAMIAKAIAQECPIILLDEPTAFLDLPSRIAMMMMLRRLSMQQHKTILLSTHDTDLALQYADRIWLLSQTAGLVTGSPEQLVLSGEFGRFFATGDIRFDATQGQFTVIRDKAPTAFVAMEIPNRLWICHMAVRNGFRIVSEPENAALRLTPDAHDPDGCQVIFRDRTFDVASLEDLSQLFETIRPQ